MASDLVNDSKLSVRFSTKHTHHVVFESDDRPGQRVRRQRKEESWERVKHLGKGGGGSVWLEHCLSLSVDSQPKTRAVKAIPKESSLSQTIGYRRELEAIAKFSQTKYEGLFVRSFGWYEDATFAYIAMEYFELRDLGICIKQPLPELEAQQITYQLLEGLEQLHLSGYAHRDLKPANIFVVKKSPDWWVKIGDLGISKRVNGGQTSLRTAIGTRNFVAPEVLEDGSDSQYTAKVDIWSLGVLVHYMITKTLPFDDKRTLPEYIRTSHFPSTDLVTCNVSKECHDFITKGLLSITAASRLSASDALQHQWLGGLYASDPYREANEANLIQHGRATEHINGTEMASRAGSKPDEWTEASASWSDQVGTERQLPVRIKHEAAQGAQPIALQQSSSPKGVSLFDHPYKLHTSHDEGISLMGQQQYSGAQRMLQKAFELRNDAFGTYHEDTLASLGALGDAFCGQEIYAEAEAAYREVWVRRRRVLGENHAVTLSALYVLGKALYHQEKYAEAEGVYRDVWEARKRALGSHHEDTLASLSALGDVLYGQGMYAEAEVAYRDVSVRQKRAIGESHTDTLRSLHVLGKALYSQDKFVEAEDVYQKAWESRKRAIGEDNEETMASLAALGDAFCGQGKYAETEAAYRDVWVRRRRVLGEQNSDTLDSLHWLGIALYFQGKPAEAEDQFRNAWVGRKQAIGEQHPDTLNSLHWLGRALGIQDKYTEAEDRFRNAWNGRKQAIGEQHPDTLNSLHWLGRALGIQDKCTEAEDQFRNAWNGCKQALGEQHSDTLDSLHWLGIALYFQGKPAEAEDQFRNAWIGRKQALGEQHSDTLDSLHWLGIALYFQGKSTEAESTPWNGRQKSAEAEDKPQSAWQGRKQALGEQHSDTLDALSWLRNRSA